MCNHELHYTLFFTFFLLLFTLFLLFTTQIDFYAILTMLINIFETINYTNV